MTGQNIQCQIITLGNTSNIPNEIDTLNWGNTAAANSINANLRMNLASLLAGRLQIWQQYMGGAPTPGAGAHPAWFLYTGPMLGIAPQTKKITPNVTIHFPRTP